MFFESTKIVGTVDRHYDRMYYFPTIFQGDHKIGMERNNSLLRRNGDGNTSDTVIAVYLYGWHHCHNENKDKKSHI